VALSADGATALVGAPWDSGYAGSAWVFTHSGPTWRQEGPKLTGAGEVVGRDGEFGQAVGLSADGSAALVGGTGHGDYEAPGAAWAFRRAPASR
jgi:hypothetical protein